MLSRVIVMLIVGFWLAMTSLLVVREFYPEATSLNRVPIGSVGRVIFQHNQASDLIVYDAGKEVGYIRLQPRQDPDAKKRSVDYQGRLHINPLGLPRQNVSCTGGLILDDGNQLKSVTLGFGLEGPARELTVAVDCVAKTACFTLRNAGVIVDQSTITLDRDGFGALMQRVGLDSSLFQQVQSTASTAPAPEVSAQQSSIKLNGETVSTYLVSIKMSDQMLLEAHVSQLGQVLRAQIPIFGYKLALRNIPP